ncbi:DUF2490 domain-containing protein [Pedobacter sp. MW01-1-1]|uniref:DUF2490 domain-containing protein n=1 Tax=Pedobacter sp. MW01-1-1 TaxID=3383027 RepID=UPI003FEECE55
MKKILLFISLLCIGLSLSAQTVHQNSGWFLFLNSTKFNDKWGMHFDFQVRSADDWGYVRNTLIRPGVTYYINPSSNATVGYLWVTNTAEIPATGAKITANEHRIWEQYIYNHKLKSVFVSHRLRLEQRFFERANEDVFAQRFRYFFRMIQPLQKAEPKFTKGPFVALQNEIFLNVQNNSNVNNSFFDQNRAYLAVGYRFSKAFDLEAGYLNQYIKGAAINSLNNVIQLGVYTRF